MPIEWNEPFGIVMIEAMACGTPSIYSDWGGQLQFAEGKGIPVKIDYLRPANIEHKDFPGEYCEPDWDDLKRQMRQAYDYNTAMWVTAVGDAKDIHKKFNWDTVAKGACEILERNNSAINAPNKRLWLKTKRTHNNKL